MGTEDEKTKSEAVNNANNFEEVQIYQEVEQAKKAVRTDSYFDGGLLELIGWKILSFLIISITFGIATPWAKCMLYSYQIKHTVYNGKRLKFEGTGGDLFVNMFKWIFFTIITLGIYSLFVPIKKTKWVISNIHFEDEKFVKDESFFDGKTLHLIGLNILCNILNLISFGLLIPFTTCLKLRWINKHTVINRKKLVFSGKAISLFGKYILWYFLTIITFGIFGLWLPIKMLKWQSKNTHIKSVGEEDKEKDKSFLIIIPIVMIVVIVAVIAISSVISKIANMSEFDWMALKYKVQEIGQRNTWYDQRDMYDAIFKKYGNNEITKDEVYKLIKEYNLTEYAEETVGEQTRIEFDFENGYYSSGESTPISDILIPETPTTPVTPTTPETPATPVAPVTPVEPAPSTSITVGGYTLNFGTYTGTLKQFDWEAQEEINTPVTLVLSENNITINGESGSYSTSGTKIIWNGQDYMLEVSGNNRITYIVENCPDLIYQGY